MAALTARPGLHPVIIDRPRGVAQSGSAPGWGPGGRRFKSCLPDLTKSLQIEHVLGEVLANLLKATGQFRSNFSHYGCPGSRQVGPGWFCAVTADPSAGPAHRSVAMTIAGRGGSRVSKGVVPALGRRHALTSQAATMVLGASLDQSDKSCSRVVAICRRAGGPRRSSWQPDGVTGWLRSRVFPSDWCRGTGALS